MEESNEKPTDWPLYLASEGFSGNFLRSIHPANKSLSQERKRELSNAFKNEGSRKLTIRCLDGVIENLLKFNLSEAESDLKQAKKYRAISRNYPETYYALASTLYQFCDKVFSVKKENISFATI